jgi:hypothetical protein
MEDINYKVALAILLRSMMKDYVGSKDANHASRLIVGMTPQILVDVGFPLLPLMIDGKVIDKAFFDHGISKSMLERLYTLIATPKAIYKAHQAQPGSVVVTYEIKSGDPIIVPIHPDRQKTRTGSFNVIASVYPKASNNGASIEMRLEGRWIAAVGVQGRNCAAEMKRAATFPREIRLC